MVTVSGVSAEGWAEVSTAGAPLLAAGVSAAPPEAVEQAVRPRARARARAREIPFFMSVLLF